MDPFILFCLYFYITPCLAESDSWRVVVPMLCQPGFMDYRLGDRLLMVILPSCGKWMVSFRTSAAIEVDDEVRAIKYTISPGVGQHDGVPESVKQLCSYVQTQSPASIATA